MDLYLAITDDQVVECTETLQLNLLSAENLDVPTEQVLLPAGCWDCCGSPYGYNCDNPSGGWLNRLYDNEPVIAINATACGDNVCGWIPWDGGGQQNFDCWSTTSSIDRTGINNAAPEKVYQTILFSDQPITYTAANLLSTAEYTVRLHFAGIFPELGEVAVEVWINGDMVNDNFDPFISPGGLNKASVQEFGNVTPDSQGQITVSLVPATPGNNNVSISGIEIRQE